ncbi:hypothetical protein GCM10027418_14030 [Mariniluteicoccus endophyticus]
MSTRADRAYLRRFAVGMGSYVLLLPLAMWLARGPLAGSPGRFAAVLLVIPSALVIVWALWRYVREADELQARMLVESLAIAFAAGSVLTFTWGMLQTVGAPDLSWTFVMPVSMGAWAIATALVRRRY